MEIMNTRLEKRDIYTRESLTGIAKRCDLFINGYQILRVNYHKLDTIFLTAYTAYDGIRVFADDILPRLKYPFILIIASEDCTFPTGIGELRWNPYYENQDLIKRIVESPLLIHIFVENLDISHYKMTPIPLGILETGISIDDIKFKDSEFSERPNLCIIRNRLRDGLDQWADRARADELSKTVWSDFMTCIEEELSHDDFMNELKKAKFCLIIHGGGYDPCPKFFECILYGVIPIIQHSPLDEAFCRYPIVFIDELTKDALSKDFLEEKYEELKEYYQGENRKNFRQLLTIDYWWDIITDKLHNFSP
jgi:hypothetical protein